MSKNLDDIDIFSMLEEDMPEDDSLEFEEEQETSEVDLTLDEGDFDFSGFYQEDEEEVKKEEVKVEELGVFSDEEAYDEILDLHSNAPVVAVQANYPYIRISGFLIKDEIIFMKQHLTEYMDKVKSRYSHDELLDVMLNINGDDYNVGRAPLILDTFLTIFRAHRYDVSIVRSEASESQVTSELMKAFLFT